MPPPRTPLHHPDLPLHLPPQVADDSRPVRARRHPRMVRSDLRELLLIGTTSLLGLLVVALVAIAYAVAR